MIAYLKGSVAYKDGYAAVIDVNGVGYSLNMSSKSLASLPAVGGSARVWTHMHVKEDGITLFGFCDGKEREMFLKLIEVSGIGPKIAIAALSTYSAQQLAAIIAEGDVAAITRIPGIGKKTAQRAVLELQGILSSEAVGTLPLQDNSALADASQALQSMGFTSEEVAAAFRDQPVEGLDVSQLVRLGLKNVRS